MGDELLDDSLLVEEPIGVKEIKEVIKFVVLLGNAIGGSLEDGKWGLDDIGKFMPAIAALIPAINGIGIVGDELNDLEDEELAELVEYFKDEFDVPQDDVEDMIENGFDLAVELFDFIKMFFMPKE